MTVRSAGSRAIAVCALAATAAAPARAQDPLPRPHAFELSVGFGAESGRDLGVRAGSLTANDPGGPDYALFRTGTSVGAATGVESRVAFNLTRSIALEGTFSWNRRTVTTHVTADVEGAPATTASLRATTWGVGGDLLAHVRRLSFAGGRGVPFLAGGARYLRQLDEHRLLVGTGSSLDAGGGVKYFFTSRARGVVRSLGVRADARVVVSSGKFVPIESSERHAGLGVYAGLLAGF